MKKLIPIVFLILLFLFVSCSQEPSYPTEPKPQKLSDPRFNGFFSYYESLEGWYESDGYWYESYTFDGTNKLSNYVKYWYWNGSSCSISGEFKGDHYDFDMEIEVNESKTMFRTRLWDNEYSTWSDWEKYEFLDNGTVLRIYPFPDDFPNYYRDFVRK